MSVSRTKTGGEPQAGRRPRSEWPTSIDVYKHATAVQYIEASATSCGRWLGAGRFAQLLCEIFNELGGLWWGPLVHGARYVYSLRSTDVDSRHRDR